MTDTPLLTCVAVVLPEKLQVLHHAMHEINDLLLQTNKAFDGAAATGRVDILKWLHNTRTIKGMTGAMSIAARNGHLEVVEWLWENSNGWHSPQALKEAAENGHVDVVKKLVNLFGRACDTEAAILAAAANGHCQVLEYFQSEGFFGVELWHVCDKAVMSAASGGHIQVLQFFAKYRIFNFSFGCALVGAAKNGHCLIVAWLLDRNSYSRSSYNFSAAMKEAARKGHAEVVDMLTKYCSPDAISRALDGAAENGHTDVVKCLLATHALRNVTMSSGSQLRGLSPVASAVLAAASSGNVEILQLLLCENCNPTDLQHGVELAAAKGNRKTVEMLMLVVRDQHCMACCLKHAEKKRYVHLAELLRKMPKSEIVHKKSSASCEIQAAENFSH